MQEYKKCKGLIEVSRTTSNCYFFIFHPWFSFWGDLGIFQTQRTFLKKYQSLKNTRINADDLEMSKQEALVLYIVLY